MRVALFSRLSQQTVHSPPNITSLRRSTAGLHSHVLPSMLLTGKAEELYEEPSDTRRDWLFWGFSTFFGP